MICKEGNKRWTGRVLLVAFLLPLALAAQVRPDTAAYDPSVDTALWSSEPPRGLIHRLEQKLIGGPADSSGSSRHKVRPIVFYSNEDRLYAGVGSVWTRSPVRGAGPSGYRHALQAHYSLTQGAPSFRYSGEVHGFIGPWTLELGGGYDWVRWTNFYGVGNETPMRTDDRDYYRMRNRLADVRIGLLRPMGNYHQIGISGFYQGFQLIEDAGRFLDKNGTYDVATLYETQHFAGTSVNYAFQRTDERLMPARGWEGVAAASWARPFDLSERHYTRYEAGLQFYLPLLRSLVWTTRTGAITTGGEPRFFQLASIGGNRLRGYRSDRFWGKTAVHVNNELQWRFPIARLKGRAALLGFYDIGRVWQPGEQSDTWHRGLGGGLLLAPFNKLAAAVMYGISGEDAVIHVRFRRNL